MFDHVTIRVSDREASERFYETVLGTLRVAKTYSGGDFAEWNDFSLAQSSEANPVTRRLHLGFWAPSRARVDEFWRVGTEAGYRDDGEPGPRPQYRADYYGGFLLDPDGNSAEAVHYGATRDPGQVDHLWIRVADLAAAAGFYERAAPYSGFRRSWTGERPDRVGFSAGTASFSVVEDGAPTEHAHVAFSVRDNATVDEFHRALTESGFRDNGAPGERSVYHAGYYAAYVLDADGNNIEAVCHNR